MRAWAAATPDVADRQRQRVGGVGRAWAGRRAAAAGSPWRRPGPCRPARCPVTAALTSLGVCSATGSPRRAATTIAIAAGLGGAHHGADVVLGEDPLDRDRVGPVLVEPGLDAALDVRPAAAAIVLVGRGADHVDVDQPQRPADAPSTTPMPQRVSPGSIPSTRMSSPSAVRPSEHLFVRTLAGAVAETADDTLGFETVAERPPQPPKTSSVELGQHVVRDVEVGEDVLHVVEVLQRVDQPEHLPGARRRRPGCPCSRRTGPRRSRSRSRRPAARCVRPPGRSPRTRPRRTRRGR